MKTVRILSDYTSTDNPNFIQITLDDQNDFHLVSHLYDETDKGVRISLSGSRYSNRVRNAIKELIDACESDASINKDLQEFNS